MLIGAIKEDVSASLAHLPSPAAASAKGSPRPPTVGVLFGTHNWTSCKLILDELVASGLAKTADEGGEEPVVRLGEDVTERITMGQLYGVSPFQLCRSDRRGRWMLSALVWRRYDRRADELLGGEN